MSRKQELIALTSELVSYKSVTANQKECHAIMEFVTSLFNGKGFFVSWYECEGVPSIIISRKRTHEYRIIFNGHLDVVPAPSDACFEAELIGSRLHGRGTADMKGSCAVMIQLFLDHADDALLDECALVLTGDEEVGGLNGVGFLVNDIGIKADVVVVPDGGDAFIPCIFEKGIQHCRLEAFGAPAHGSRPWLGDSAVDTLLDELTVLRERFQTVSEQEQWGVSLNIGQITGGKATNLVADYACAHLDFRFPPSVGLGPLRKQIEESLTRTKLTYIGHGEAVSVDENCAEYKIFCEILEEFGGSGKGIPEHGACDARWFVDQGSVILITKPLGSPYHVDDEWVDCDSLDKLYGVFSTLCRRLLEPAQQKIAV